VYKRKHIKGWWCGWYEGGKRKAKALPGKALAEHFRHMKYAQLNSDVFTSVVEFDWRHMVDEYGQFKQVEGRKDASIYEVLLTLRHFERLVGCSSSREITQPNLDAFVLKRSEEVGKRTLNKDITNLRAFLKWAARNRFVAAGPGDPEGQGAAEAGRCLVRAPGAGSAHGRLEVPDPAIAGAAGRDNGAAAR
jgi:hypothetical protein